LEGEPLRDGRFKETEHQGTLRDRKISYSQKGFGGKGRGGRLRENRRGRRSAGTEKEGKKQTKITKEEERGILERHAFSIKRKRKLEEQIAPQGEGTSWISRHERGAGQENGQNRRTRS